MSSYSDFANAASDILLKKGAAEARGREDSGQIWGNTLATLGDVIPKQVQQVLQQRAAKQKTAQIQAIIQQNGGDLEKALPLIMGVDVGIGTQIGEHVAKVNKDVAEYQGIQLKNKLAEVDFADRALQGVDDEDSYVRWAILQKKLGRQVPPQFDPAFIKQEKANLIAQKQALEPQFAYGADVGVYNKYTGETKTPSTPRTPKTETELAIDAADPNSPTQARSIAALKSLRGTTGGLKTITELRIDAANPNSPTQAQSQQILDNLPADDKGITGPEADEKFRQIQMKPPNQRTVDEMNWAKAYREQKTMVPTATFQMNAPVRQDARTDRGYTAGQRELDALRKPIAERAERLARLGDALNQQTPQADALLAPELLSVMAGGQGSGLRMNEAEIERIIGGRSKWESLKATLNKWSLDPSKALSVTPEQRKEMRDLMRSVQTRTNSQMQSLDRANQALIDADSVEQQRQIIANINKELTSAIVGGAATSTVQPTKRYNPATGKAEPIQ